MRRYQLPSCGHARAVASSRVRPKARRWPRVRRPAPALFLC